MGIEGYTSGIVTGIMGWATSMLFWALVLVGLFIGFVGMMIIRRNKRFMFPVLEIISLGQGKIRVNLGKGGWFKSKKMFFGLHDYAGEDEMLVKGKFLEPTRKVFYASSVDYHDIFGKRGLIVKRKDDDPEILVPLTKFEIKNLSLIGEIAPADYRDAAVKILEEKQKETLSWWDENKALIISTIVFVFGIVSLIIIFKFAQQESAAWRDALMNQCKSKLASLASKAP